MRSLLPSIAVLALVSLTACDNAKPRPAGPQMQPQAATPARAGSIGLPKRPQAAGFYLDAIGGTRDPLNRPATIRAGEPVAFGGFGFDPVARSPGAAVDIVIDGVAHPTAYGHARPDVADYFKTPGLVNTGFAVTLPAGVVRPGRHQAVVRVVSADGAGYFDSVAIGFVAK